jgi:predicted 3-demethylubiquinone-9 3-methyltransferase (glyoxalase superfamily)
LLSLEGNPRIGMKLFRLSSPGRAHLGRQSALDSEVTFEMRITTLLMFSGQAEAALHCYVSLIPSSSIEYLERYGPEEPGPAGSVKRASVLLAGSRYMFIDSSVRHDFGFTPATSLFVDFDSKEQLESVMSALEVGGKTFMPAENYGFSRLFCWLQDKWGVSWQLNLQ